MRPFCLMLATLDAFLLLPSFLAELLLELDIEFYVLLSCCESCTKNDSLNLFLFYILLLKFIFVNMAFELREFNWIFCRVGPSPSSIVWFIFDVDFEFTFVFDSSVRICDVGLYLLSCKFINLVFIFGYLDAIIGVTNSGNTSSFGWTDFFCWSVIFNIDIWLLSFMYSLLYCGSLLWAPRDFIDFIYWDSKNERIELWLFKFGSKSVFLESNWFEKVLFMVCTPTIFSFIL